MTVLKGIFIYLFIQFIFLTSVGQSPNILWQKSLGGSYYDKAVSVIELEDGGYIIGGHSQSSNSDLSINHGGYDWWIMVYPNSWTVFLLLLL